MNKEYPLGFSETYFCLVHELNLDNSNTASLVEIEGNLDVEVFKQALYHVYARNPALRSRYEKDTETYQYFFQFDIEFDEIEITITDVDVLNLSSGIAALEDCIRTLYKPRGSLWRVNLLRSTGEKPVHYLVLGFHHAIIDGISVLNVVKSIINYYHALATQKTVNSKSLKISPSASVLINEKKNYAQHCQNQEILFRKYGKVKELAYEKKVLPTETKTRIILCDFTKDILDKTVAFAKLHGVTITSVLIASLLRATYVVTGQEETFLQIPVNLRKQMQPELSDEIIGCYENGVKVLMKSIGEYNSLERLAQDYQGQFTENFKMFYIPSDDYPAKKLYQLFRSSAVWERDRFLLGLVVSNWGRVPLNEKPQMLKINAIHRATGRQFGDSPFCFHIATINDELQGAFNYAEPYMSQQRMTDIIQVFRTLLINVGKSW
ncbi:condensation domain-containing protein [Legionella shakespearei]|uniref:Non-ribosomal peptide synthase n=1 Tax=Legionella shakespearei DSM 23087 TaxID=1122169 RepID=A0A0W0YKW6_9GAMM|nr:condensation domain-containing protein [Legionella shakespearei]KTD57520.1 non-ribosomal peptide synthase [Legionella shakespearei DSM 23087]